MSGRTRVVAGVITGLVVVLDVLFLVTLVAHVRSDSGVPIYEYWLEGMSFPVFWLLTVLLVTRRPENPLSWFFASVTLAGSIQGGLGSLAHWLAASGNPGAVPALSLVASGAQMGFVLFLITTLLLFPTGRLPGPRWTPVGWMFALGAIAGVLSTLTGEELSVGPDVANPLAGALPLAGLLGPVGTVGMAVGALGGLAAIVVRFRRSRGVERQQLRWFLASVVAGFACILLVPFGSLGWAIGPTLVPVGVAVAILRYRLYDLDRIVSRTVTYALLTVVIGGLYVGVVVGSQQALGLDGAPDLVVAAATLAAAALVRPLRRRIQRAVDRRFDRAVHDHEVVLDAFREHLRDEVDLNRLTADLRRAVSSSLRPAHQALWLPISPNGDQGHRGADHAVMGAVTMPERGARTPAATRRSS